MREFRTSGSVGAPAGKLAGATQQSRILEKSRYFWRATTI